MLVDESTRYFDAVYDRLGVLLEPDDLMGESAYNELLPEVVRRLDDAHLLQISDGAAVVFPPGFTNRHGEPLPLIVRKSDGGYGYAATDLATVIDRVERLGATLLLYVVGAPQAQHLQMVWAVAEEAGWLRPPARAVHVPFGNVLGPDRKMLKSRAGDSVKLVDLLDEAVQRAEEAIAEKNPELAARGAVGRRPRRRHRRGEVRRPVDGPHQGLRLRLGADAVLRRRHRAVPPVRARPHLLHLPAGRHRPGRRRGEVQPVLGEPEERALSLRLLGYDAAVADTLERYSPHRLTAYLFDLALDFTAFYEACPVLRAPDETTRDSRLALADLTARVLAHGLGLLGIDVPERM